MTTIRDDIAAQTAVPHPPPGATHVLAAERYELLDHAAHYLQQAREYPDHRARYADLAEQFTALAIQAGVTRAEAEARLVGGEAE